VSQKSQESDLTDVGAFARHVRTGDQSHLQFSIQPGVVRDEPLFVQVLFENGMPSIANIQNALIANLRLGNSCKDEQFPRTNKSHQLR